jgi:tRNA A-37 threonylcarbamoyl transferase component Bud32
MEKIIKFCDEYSDEEIKIIIRTNGEILKDTERSFVKVVDYNGKKIIVKQPCYKNRKKIEQILTLIKDSEVVRVLKSMKILNKNGIKTNKEIAAVEIRKSYLITDSYIIAEYLEGEIIDESNLEKAIELLKSIHKLGYLHSDPQYRNFIVNKNGIGTIDAKLKIKKFGKISENLEYRRLVVEKNSAEKFIEKNVWYKAACFLYEVFRFKRRIRKYFKERKKVGILKLKDKH